MESISVARSYTQDYSSAKEFLPCCVSGRLDWEVFAGKMIFPFVFHPCRAQHCGTRAVGNSPAWFLVLCVNSETSHCSWYLISQRQSSPCPACSAKVTLSAPSQRFVF